MSENIGYLEQSSVKDTAQIILDLTDQITDPFMLSKYGNYSPEQAAFIRQEVEKTVSHDKRQLSPVFNHWTLKSNAEINFDIENSPNGFHIAGNLEQAQPDLFQKQKSNILQAHFLKEGTIPLEDTANVAAFLRGDPISLRGIGKFFQFITQRMPGNTIDAHWDKNYQTLAITQVFNTTNGAYTSIPSITSRLVNEWSRIPRITANNTSYIPFLRVWPPGSI